MVCPLTKRLVAYAQSREDSWRIEAHLVGCEECRALVADLEAFFRGEGDDLSPEALEVAWRYFERLRGDT